MKDKTRVLWDRTNTSAEGGRLDRVGLALSDKDQRVILTLNEKYITALKQKIEQRFHVFMSSIPRQCGNGIASLRVLANHYYQDSGCKEQETEELFSDVKCQCQTFSWEGMPPNSPRISCPLGTHLFKILTTTLLWCHHSNQSTSAFQGCNLRQIVWSPVF